MEGKKKGSNGSEAVYKSPNRKRVRGRNPRERQAWDAWRVETCTLAAGGRTIVVTVGTHVSRMADVNVHKKT